MKERPIIFNSERVRAILDGKMSQTRRPLKIQPPDNRNWERFTLIETTDRDKNKHVGKMHWCLRGSGYNICKVDHRYFKCPFGQVGDRLWVRETWLDLSLYPNLGEESEKVWYKADEDCEDAIYYNVDEDRPKWKPSIHMPRWASRITLEITDVKVERVQDITGKDVLKEGVGIGCVYPRKTFEVLWNSTYGKGQYSWDNNPLVWAIDFKKREGNYD